MEDEEDETVQEKSFAEDERVQFVGLRLAHLLRLKEDKWSKFLEEEPNQKLVTDFLESNRPAFLAFYISVAGGLTVETKIPSVIKHKLVWVMKTENCIGTENYKEDLRLSELSGIPLEHVMVFLEKVVVPVLSSKKNNGSWPHVISQDMERHIEIIKNKTYVMNGIVSGKILLPLPTIATKTDLQDICTENKESSEIRSVLHEIESMVIKWSHQIKDILERNTAKPPFNQVHPDPEGELKFWKEKKDNLLCIYDQLKSPTIQKLIGILNIKKSSYYPTFQDIYKDVENALIEAEDIELYLKSLERYIQFFEESEFPEIHILIPPLFHTICLIWSHSKFYNVPARIISLLQEFCNLFIHQATLYLSPEDIMKREAEETLEQVQSALKTLRSFKDAFFNERKQMATYFTSSQEVRFWDFKPQMVFGRFDMFLNRLEKIENIFVTMLEFEKLEKLEFGGIKGKSLNAQICKLNEEFIESCNTFKEKTYDPLDYNNMEFEEDYADFKHKNLEFERHLGAIFCVAFLDCSGLESAFKLITILGSFLEKPVISEMFSTNYKILLQMFDEELRNCKYLYDEHIKQEEKGNEVLNKNMSFTSGNLKWSREIKARLLSFWSSFSFLPQQILENFEATLIYQKYIEFLRLLDHYEDQIYFKWKSKVDDICLFNLDQPLIKQNGKDGLLTVNFDPKLVAVLRDVKYLLLMDQPNIPSSALELYKKRRTFANENLKLLKADPDSDSWKIYLEFVDDIIADGFFNAIKYNLNFFLEDTEKALKPAPLFQVQMILSAVDIEFKPSLDKEAGDGFYDLIDELLSNIFKTSAQVKRMALHLEIQHYQNDMDDISELSTIREKIMNRVADVITEAINFKNSLDCYAYLWVDDRSEFMKQFLFYGRVLTSEETEIITDVGTSDQHPTAEQFKEQIDIYEHLYIQMSKFEDFRIFEGWLKVDLKPFKHSLLNLIKKWSWMFKEYLVKFVIDSLSDLEEFIKMTNLGLQKQLSEIDYNGLIDIMFHLLAVRHRQSATDDLFEPLKDTIVLLENYGQKMPDHIYIQVEELPEKWNATKKLAVSVKHEVAPFLTSEVTILRKKCAAFDGKQIGFRERFRADAPFHFGAQNPYALLDKANLELERMEEEMLHLQESANLFEVAVPEYKQIKECRKEIKLLKGVWDINISVTSSIDDWTKKHWRESNIEQMEVELRRFAKEIWTLDKEVRSWNVYTSLELTIKNLLTSLRVVIELQNPAIRDRHWYQLMETIGVQFSITEDTTLANLLALNLHNVEDEIQKIVDKAVKELGIEKILIEISQTWAAMEFSYEEHFRTNIFLLKMDEQLFETLDNNQVQLQTVLQSKYVEYFIEQVITWQKKLNVADSVIYIWVEVQRTWSHLESIFIGSNDIREQLPEDSKRFDCIDMDFKELMNDSTNTRNVLEAATKPNLYEKLQDLQHRFSLCEKALAEYLETKRLAFPRFYFVSSADLLDILSKGTQPKQVTCHLIKLFDNIADLKFQDNEDEQSNIVLGMYSKEKEYVPFSGQLECSSQVETWLKRLEDTMHESVRYHITEAITVYEEKPREQWIIDYPAQIALTGSQIWWTTDVGIAFSRLEEGFETALKDYHKKQIAQLNTLIALLLGDLTPSDRQKIMTICTIDVHARDVVAKLLSQKIVSSQAFPWLSQLRHRWDWTLKHCFANICDAQFQYYYEYLGNTPRLVITPLTDRCYITLTQSLHLTMSGAPAGPAGTGKTETTKDLGHALGMMVYVFNCSEQMDYKSIGNIYKGLVQTGAWGCFDEFNRISVEVLSVVAVQVKTIHDAIRNNKKQFTFLGENITLKTSVGIFITMNPGYAGRTELPENLKTLFRPCAMVVPDIELICEIMLVAEGFIDARLLARKFVTLYTLCRELLSKQDHYDWGLRAIKSVLVVAGSLKRGDKTRPEDQILMRALRDFNLPKIVTDDMPIFMGLISDLFPTLDVPRKRDLQFEQMVKQSTLELHLQPEETFILKVVQLEELLAVRHSVFVVGNAGTGKSKILKTLNKTYMIMKQKPVWNDLNPKAVITDELFGFIHHATREWKDGLFSSLLREQANMSHNWPKWIVLDGDIDPMWIESLNTVMDDNKVLTLASNERIPLTPSMRLLFEIHHLKTATPATVSRAGILYVNPQDLGWNPYVASWIESRTDQSEKANLTIFFDKYVPPCLDQLRTNFKTIIPISENSIVQTLCTLLDCLLIPENMSTDGPRDVYEIYFAFACVWAFGGALFQDQLYSYQAEFSQWWLKEMKSVKFPTHGTIFDYYLDPQTKRFFPWNDKISSFVMDPETPLQAELVHTSETTCLKYFVELLLENSKPVMLVGNAGVGKTLLIGKCLANLSKDFLVSKVPFNYYTTSATLQRILEKSLEKKAGRNYGPIGNRKLIYFIDDLNMPEVDIYGTVQPHTLIRQHIDYRHWYDRRTLSVKEINHCQYVACMNPTVGSFTINPRLQRHFAVFAMNFPSADALSTIYGKILDFHFQLHNFNSSILNHGPSLIQAAIWLHQTMVQSFLPTAIKFHYIFNLRDLSNIFQGIRFAKLECLKHPHDLVRLWLHESSRVYGDKLIEEKDCNLFYKRLIDTAHKYFEDVEDQVLLQKPLIYSHFANGVADHNYMPVTDWEMLRKILLEALENYNEINASMNLVLFEDAIQHVCRINRILESSCGYALLIGVGGSGKQSLSRLAAYLGSLEVFQTTLRKDYTIEDLKVDLASLYIKTGARNIPTVFLLTDAQVPDEHFLVLINDLLASGEIPDLFTDEDTDSIIAGMKNEIHELGLTDTRENCWNFFLNRVQLQLKIILCFSPVGSTLRVRARKFPAIVNCTAIDWFHEWPQEALESVSRRFIEEMPGIKPQLYDSICYFMAYAHASVNEISAKFQLNEKRYNYTTPKSFLEQIMLFKNLLQKKILKIFQHKERLINGIQKLKTTASQVEDLKYKLASQEAELQLRNQDAEALITKIGLQTEKVSKEKAIADAEEQKVVAIQAEVSRRQKECEDDLMKAEPALVAATAALDTLNKVNISELKAFPNPPDAVTNVAAAVMVLLANKGKVPRDRTWKAAKLFMGKVDEFLQALINYDKEHIPENCLKVLKEHYLKDSEFSPNLVRNKSFAAAGLCAWVINIVKFYEVYCDVEPKRRALTQANVELTAATEKLEAIRKKLIELDHNLCKLTSSFEKATAEKVRCQEEVSHTNKTIDLANRLVKGLQSENIRWSHSIKSFEEQEITACGDVLLTAAFVSYVGPFTKLYREELVEHMWLPFLKLQKIPIPISTELDLVAMLTDDAMIATWNNEGLPSDKMSIENAAILTNCERWPLLIDPQLQAIKWIKNKYGTDLKIMTVGEKGFLKTIERTLACGDVVLIENLDEKIDPVLDPLLGRNTIKRGKYIKIEDRECEFNKNFRLILHTKMANPHYKPELQAQTTLINFTVTKDGLEDQLLADVVSIERPELETVKSLLTKQQNDFKIQLKVLEDELLFRLSDAEGSFLGDTELVEKLENTKLMAAEIEFKAAEARENEVNINEAREYYRPAAARSSLLYFVIQDLSKINPMYQFSLKAFNNVFHKAIEKAEASDDIQERISNLTESITYFTFIYISQGFFERDKLIFLGQTIFQILLENKEIEPTMLNFLLLFKVEHAYKSPVDFLTTQSWSAIKAIALMDEFRGLDKDIEGSVKRWKKWVDSECPEKEKLPQEWKNKTSFERLIILRALCPDRITYALRDFVEEKLGSKYVDGTRIDLAKSYEESSPATPVFFILSPGVDPLKDMETLGKKLGFTIDCGKLHNISLGQGQEIVAEKAIEKAAKHGHWVILQNIHLVVKWLGTLEILVDKYSKGSHCDYRLFISAEPAPTPEEHVIPQGILENSIKLINEPPTGMLANLHAALYNFDQDTLELCTREQEFKSIFFSLCYFHTCVAGRLKFGPQGWNRRYPFNMGDLTICVNVLYNYLEASTKVPWEDLCYLFGEIMYGGHITDDWDRRLCHTYLEEFMSPSLLEGDFALAPGFPSPPNLDYIGYHKYIDGMLPVESPTLYGLHPNAEIDFLTVQSDNLFKTLLEMQPRNLLAGEITGQSLEEKVKNVLDEILEKLPEEFNLADIMQKSVMRSPYILVCFQECERMNILIREIRRSIKQLDLGLKGELTFSSSMETLQSSLFYDQVPDVWSSLAYPSTYSLAQWFNGLLLRCRELDTWTQDLVLPAVVWLSGFFNPQSFLTAIMQTTARKNNWSLDKMCLTTDVTKKSREDYGHPPREGAYIFGLYMEGARWDIQAGVVAEARLKDLTPMLPVIFARAIPVERQETKQIYKCPVYKTKLRGPTYTWTFNLKTKEKPSKWVLAGVALLLEV
ncbi:dynein axonemal heavy chain 11 isoform X3 [Erythrolamprus reginae]|uniref:dynein axonemal heavy chain 11 isoform X3 n=1 Tax=Erythrolamprus reginae TaxID=121349 RepID=UPI00396CFA0E